MKRQGLYELADRLYEGQLERLLTDWRSESVSFEDIAHKLRENDIRVTGETVRLWCLNAGIHEKAS